MYLKDGLILGSASLGPSPVSVGLLVASDRLLFGVVSVTALFFRGMGVECTTGTEAEADFSTRVAFSSCTESLDGCSFRKSETATGLGILDFLIRLLFTGTLFVTFEGGFEVTNWIPLFSWFLRLVFFLIAGTLLAGTRTLRRGC